MITCTNNTNTDIKHKVISAYDGYVAESLVEPKHYFIFNSTNDIKGVGDFVVFSNADLLFVFLRSEFDKLTVS